LILGSRGSGKSFLAAVATHLESRFGPRLGTKILGGSKAQSAQIFEAITSAVLDGAGPGGSDSSAIHELLKTEARYRNGSHVSILAASARSVRGPHVPRLKLDEVDEIDPELREAAMGMCMESKEGAPAAVTLTSTWHRVGGPMSELLDRAKAGAFPHWTTCTFDVLQRCSPERSGPRVGGDDLYERCPSCAIRKWCHSERDRNGNEALAKLAAGHYSIDSLIQKTLTVSDRIFDADYLCRGPRADGIWYTAFAAVTHVSAAAEYDPALPVTLAVDCGLFVGAVFVQFASIFTPQAVVDEVRVFADYLSEGATPESVAGVLLELARTRCSGRLAVIVADPAGDQRNGTGRTVIGEYERAGLRPMQRWPMRRVTDSLALLDSFLRPAAGPVRLLIHPRCTNLIAALQNYRRAKRRGQWQDYPEDPQHPHEDLVDALRGACCHRFPDGRKPKEKLQTVASTIGY
jgi:hypothetical protein